MIIIKTLLVLGIFTIGISDLVRAFKKPAGSYGGGTGTPKPVKRVYRIWDYYPKETYNGTSI